jgi:SAM-dependent methyltransferase
VLATSLRLLRPGSYILDLGCGDMPYRDLIRGQGFGYLGADIVPGADLIIDPNGRVDQPSGATDAVLSIQVLEHVRDVGAYLAEIRRLLAPDGVLLLSTHGNWLYHPHPEDHWRWTRTGLSALLEDNGFAVQDVKGLVGPLATTTMIRLTGFAWALRRLRWVGAPLAALLASAGNLRAWLEDQITPGNLRQDNACVYFVRATVAR